MPATLATRSRRLSDALELIGNHFGVRPPDPDDPDELLTFLAEALAGLLTEVKPPRGGRVGR